MQFNTGKQFDELVENDLLATSTRSPTEQKWKRHDPGADRRRPRPATARCYAVPVNIHGQNWLFYNTEVLAEGRRRAEPKNWDERLRRRSTS